MAQTHDLVRRLLDTSGIARVVPSLPPEVLHRVIQQYGLEDCAELVALATPRQLERLLDLDLWRAPAPGADEALNAARFGQWIEVLLQSGPGTAGDKLAGMDRALVVGGLMAHIRVFDAAVTESYTMLDGTEVEGYRLSGPIERIGGFVIEGRGTRGWDAIVELLAHLQEDRPALFWRLMSGCVAVSDGPHEEDGFHAVLDTRERHRSDLAAVRESRRDAQGYVSPAQGRAFLAAARTLRLYGDRPPFDPVARASLRDIAPEPLVEDAQAAPATAQPPDAQAVTAVMTMLSDAGMLAPPRALIGAGDAGDARLEHVRAFAGTHPAAPEQLAFLANAVLAGCSIQDRPFTPQEASDLVLATCNLGLENWPSGWGDRDLVTAFQAGWAILHRDVCSHTAGALIDVLRDLDCSDRDVRWSLLTLRRDLIRHLEDGEPWRARPALDALLALDPAAWAVVRASLDACPAMHTTLAATSGRTLRVDPAAFTFVERNRDIAALHAFLASLPAALVG